MSEYEANNDLRSAYAGKARFSVERSNTVWKLVCFGDWTITGITEVDRALRAIMAEAYPAINIETSQVSGFDTAGAWLIERFRRHAEKQGREFTHQDGGAKHTELVEVLHPDQNRIQAVEPIEPAVSVGFVESFGRGVVTLWNDLLSGFFLIGSAIRGPQMKAGSRNGIRFMSIIHQMDHMGLRAVPVIAVMSFLIGAIIAQQGAYQLKYYGEELLTVNMVGILHFREIGVLLTAIMVAGRTGSAITAEIGTMKMREEIDALEVIGLNPVGVLIFPRLIALIIVLPILTLLSDLAGMLGAITISNFYIGISPPQFLEALQQNVPPQHMISGLIKAPFMALIIGLAASVEGLKVGGSSEDLGRRTTAAVVRSIFAVIVVDGLFAMFYAAIGY
ncbi:MAG: MlaE family lipid ABC transporter permease subunit [Rhizobiaceae bacterium]